MKAPKDSLVLIDGHALLYRAFHALPPLKTKDGTLTNAVYGFVTTIFKAIEDIKPKYIAVAFDVSGPTFRHKAFDGYKASRKPTPEELLTQIPLAYQVVESMNIPIFTKEGFEADDVIGTLAKQATEKQTPVVIVTGDKDSFQLVDELTFVYSMRRTITDTQLFDEHGVKERMGVSPTQIPDYKALAGDASDEIPGVDGIGEKTAVAILTATETVDNLYKLLDENKPIENISPRIRQKLIDSEKIARQSKELATIDRDVPVTLDLPACVVHDFDPDRVSAIFRRLEFFGLLKRLPNSTQIQSEKITIPDWQFTTLTTKNEISETVALLGKSNYLAVDTETDGLDGPIIGISLANNSSNGYYIPLVSEHGVKLSKTEITKLIKPLLENERVNKIGHNIKYDIHALAQLDIVLAPIRFDTMVAAYILGAHLRSFDFDTVCQRELGYTPIAFSDVAPGPKKSASLLSASIENVAKYASEDAIFTFRLYEHFNQKLASDPKRELVARDIDFPLIPVLATMESKGIKVDTKKLRELETLLDKQIIELRQKIGSYSTTVININSPIQLQKLLFEELKLDRSRLKNTQSGTSTAAIELDKLAGQHPIIDEILQYRELTKLQSTYITTLPKLVDKESRIHTKFSQTTAATGRLASNDPNLQNIPIRSEIGNEIRKSFVAPTGWKIISLDYSQIELRIIAHLSGDQKLIKVFNDGRDIHDEVAKALNISRREAKAINFGIIYGLSPFGLAQGLKIDQGVAKRYIDTYFSTYPELANYLTRTRQQIKDDGYVETLFGRRREIPEIKAASAILRAQAERMAINAPAQGTAADIMKMAMIQIHNWIESNYATQNQKPYLIVQVHDELLIESPVALVDTMINKAKHIMENVATLQVPLIADCAVGDNWGELHEQ